MMLIQSHSFPGVAEVQEIEEETPSRVSQPGWIVPEPQVQIPDRWSAADRTSLNQEHGRIRTGDPGSEIVQGRSRLPSRERADTQPHPGSVYTSTLDDMGSVVRKESGTVFRLIRREKVEVATWITGNEPRIGSK
jgi:hypothetical protein